MNRRTVLKAIAALPVLGLPLRETPLPRLSDVLGDGKWHYVEKKFDDNFQLQEARVDGIVCEADVKDPFPGQWYFRSYYMKDNEKCHFADMMTY